jgi:hypothetical protein
MSFEVRLKAFAAGVMKRLEWLFFKAIIWGSIIGLVLFLIWLSDKLDWVFPK